MNRQTPLYPEIGVVVGRSGHPAAGRHHRKLHPLLSYRWVLPQFGPTRYAIERAFMRAGCNPPMPSFINYATQLVCDVLVRSDALSVMPFGAVKPALANGTIALVPSTSVGARTPFARGARDLFAEATAAGFGALNDSEIIRRFRL